MQLIRKKMVKSAKEGMQQQASNSEIYGRMQAVFKEMDASPAVSTIGLCYMAYTVGISCMHFCCETDELRNPEMMNQGHQSRKIRIQKQNRN